MALLLNNALKLKILSHRPNHIGRNVLVCYGSVRYRTSVTGDYQYLQSSKVPTMHFQASLPRLPIPELSKTCQRYLAAIEPLVTPEELNSTRKIVSDFEHGPGKELHAKLVTRDKKNKHSSYISKPWFDMYLKSRVPLVINFNPFMTFKPDPRPEYNQQVMRATNMLISSLRFLKSLRAGILEPEVFHMDPAKSDTDRFRTITRLLPSRFSWYGAYYFKAFPLDMSQFGSLFNGTRIPRPQQDELLNDPTANHMLVIRNGHFYVFDALDKDGNLLPPATYHAILDYVSKRPDPVAAHSPGYLTAGNRDKWAAARSHLEAIGNKEQLRAIDTALFALVLDDNSFDGDFVKSASNMLYGEAHSRWFDKSFSLLFGRDGAAWLNFEHSWGDGVAVLRYFNEIFSESTKNPRIHPQSVPSTSVDPTQLVRKLEFRFDDRAKAEMESAKVDYQKMTDSLSIDANLSAEERTTKSYLKKQKLSPDSVFQLAFQLAYYRENGRTPASYESCSTSAFKHGRTETVRPATVYTKRFTQAVCSKSPPSPAELRVLMEQCSKYHGQLTKEAAMGQGFDRHLFVMKEIALAQGSALPALYQDPVYQKVTTYHLSTSTLSGDAFLGGGFGPVVEDGYGVAYGQLDPTNVGTFVSSYKKYHQASSFLQCIMDSMSTIGQILKATETKNPS